jgi:hypothetical protein
LTIAAEPSSSHGRHIAASAQGLVSRCSGATLLADDRVPLDAIAVDGSCERPEDYLAAYRDRYGVAAASFAAWDAAKGDDWTPEIEDKLDEIEYNHQVYDPIIEGTRFENPRSTGTSRAIDEISRSQTAAARGAVRPSKHAGKDRPQQGPAPRGRRRCRGTNKIGVPNRLRGSSHAHAAQLGAQVAGRRRICSKCCLVGDHHE